MLSMLVSQGLQILPSQGPWAPTSPSPASLERKEDGTPPTGRGRRGHATTGRGHAPYRKRQGGHAPYRKRTRPHQKRRMRAVPLSPEEKHEGLEEGPKVIVLCDLELILITVLILHVDADVAKHLGNQTVIIRGSHTPSGFRKTTQPSWLSLRTGFPSPTPA